MSNLIPIDPPDLQPLRQSFEYDQTESELKALFIKVFQDTLREAERSLNLTGMPHLGNEELMAKALKSDGVAMVMRNAERMEFMLKATRARNERRGVLYLKKYLQAVWPNVWLVEQLWHPVTTANAYPDHVTPAGDPATHFLTGRVRVTLPVTADNGLGLDEVARAFRSTLAARLMLELLLGTLFENTGNSGGLALANGTAAVMPFTAIGTLQGPSPPT